MVTKQRVLEELTLPKLKKIAKQMGIEVDTGLMGFLGKQLGVESRGPYIEALAGSRIVTLESIDRILGMSLSTADIPTRPRATSRDRPPPDPKEEVPVEDSEEKDTPEDIVQFILNRYLYKEDVQSLCEELDVPVSGTKEDLIDRLLNEDTFSADMALGYIDKEGLKDLCDILELRTSGTRDELERRVSGYLGSMEDEEAEAERASSPHMAHSPEAEAPTHTAIPASDQRAMRRDLFAPQERMGQPLEFPETPSPSLIPETHAPQIAQLQMVAEFLRTYVPSKRFRNESAYEIEMAQAMRHHFGAENVKTQVNIYGGRIDIEALSIGVEIKVPASRTQLQTLLGQISIYRDYYGPNLMVIVFNDLCKVQDVTEFANILLGKGVQVFIK